ncbi:MAG TPA: methyltransferase domain-containing protein, partial [Dehalococcoidia bacterium]|nr:methyltransferase domain-containing protein [Dehalococcoidia bacterium]
EDAAWYARRWLPLTVQFLEPLIEQLWIAPGDRALDVACGPGALVAQLAPLAGPFGSVTGLDRSAQMLAAGLRLARRHDLRTVRFVQGDLRRLPFAPDRFDVATCTFGFGNADDAASALTELRRVLTSGGRIAVLVAGAAERSPGWGLLLDALARHGLASGREEGFEATAPEIAAAWLREAGYDQVSATALTRQLRRLDFDDLWADVLAGRMPGTRLYRAQPAQTQAAIRGELHERVEAYRDGPRLLLPVEAVLAWGIAP